MTQGDIHGRRKRLSKTVEQIEESDQIRPENKEILLDFKAYLESQDLSLDRISRYMYTWKILTEHIDWSLDTEDKDLLVKLVGDINKDHVRDKELSDYTKMEYKKAIRKLYADYFSSKNPEFDGEQFTDFFTTTVKRKEVDPDRLPTPNDTKSLVKHAPRTRDKALIITLWSTGGRVGEILGLKWKDVKFKEEMATVTFRETKTGGNRTVPLRAGFVYLKDLQNQDDKGDNPEAYVFRDLHDDTQLSYNGARGILDRAADKADARPRLKTNPHAFRKGRATYLASQGMNQAQLCNFFGWVQGSQHAAVYIRMGKEDVETGLRQIYGMEEKEEEDQEDLLPVRCTQCGKLNRFESQRCMKDGCNAALSTTDMYKEQKKEEITEELKDQMIEKQIGLEDDELEEEAERILKEKGFASQNS